MKLPSRPKQHINSTKSIKSFQSKLPDEWVCRELTQDYGIDFEIEIWRDNGSSGKKAVKPTGRICKIQLKHKEAFDYSEDEASWSLIQFKVSTINYLYQHANSYIIVNTDPDYFSIARVKELKEILLDKFLQPSGATVTIPIFNRRPSWISHNYFLWLETAPDSEKLFALLGNNKKNIERDIPYFNLFGTESDFWKKEIYANIGLYYSRKRNKSRTIATLKNQFDVEDRWGKLGILEAYSYWNYRDDQTASYARQIINSDNPLEVVLGLYFMASPNDDSNIDEIDRYFCNPDCSSAIMNFNEQRAIEMAALKAFEIINTEKAFNYLLGTFLGDIYLIKKTIRGLAGDLIDEMTRANNKFLEIALQQFKAACPDVIVNDPGQETIRLYIDHVMNVPGNETGK